MNGSPLAVDPEARVISVSVDEDVNLPSMFAIEVRGLDDRHPQIPWLDDPQLSDVGSEVEVKLGYADDLQPLLKGEITTLEPEFLANRLPSVIVRGYDRRHRLQRGQKTRSFLQQKDSEIASQIASEAGLTAQAEDTEITHNYVLQANQTDLAFLQQRARAIQYEVVVDDKTLLFRPVSNADSEILTLTLDNGLLEFYPRLSSIGQVNEIKVQGWDVKNKKEVVGQSKSGDETSTMGGQTSGAVLVEQTFDTATGVISDRPIMTQAEADQIAKATFNRSVLHFITGEGICRGRTDLRAGTVIKIDQIGQRFSGQYYVTTVSHRYGPRGYYTHFTVRRTAS